MPENEKMSDLNSLDNFVKYLNKERESLLDSYNALKKEREEAKKS